MRDDTAPPAPRMCKRAPHRAHGDRCSRHTKRRRHMSRCNPCIEATRDQLSLAAAPARLHTRVQTRCVGPLAHHRGLTRQTVVLSATAHRGTDIALLRCRSDPRAKGPDRGTMRTIAHTSLEPPRDMLTLLRCICHAAAQACKRHAHCSHKASAPSIFSGTTQTTRACALAHRPI